MEASLLLLVTSTLAAGPQATAEQRLLEARRHAMKAREVLLPQIVRRLTAAAPRKETARP